jgi:E3 ubiquitin-protein ligase ZSWIM2
MQLVIFNLNYNINTNLFLFPVTWQLGLVEREINELLRGLLERQQRRTPQRQINKDVAIAMVENRETLEQREISEEDVCPICQDELLAKHEPVTFCKYV